jgi:hypothetical protein
MTDDERARAVRKSRQQAEATIARLRWLDDVGDDEGDGRVDECAEPELTTSDLPPLPDPLERWREEMDAIAAEREEAKAEIASVPRPAVDWDEIDRRIALWLERERKFLAQALGEQTGKLLVRERRDVMKALREELRELKIECAKLGSESAELRRELALDRGKVVDLPSPLRRRSVN